MLSCTLGASLLGNLLVLVVACLRVQLTINLTGGS